MKTNRIKLFFVNLFDLLIGKIISVKIAESEKKIRHDLELTEQSYRELVNPLSDSVGEMEILLTPKKAEEMLDPSLYKIEEKGLVIRVTDGYDKDRKYFHPSLPCWKDGNSEFIAKSPLDSPHGKFITCYSNYNDKGNRSRYTEKATISTVKFIEALFSTNCVAEIETDSAFKFRITKPGSLNWDEAIPKINNAIASLFPGKEENQTSDVSDQSINSENK